MPFVIPHKRRSLARKDIFSRYRTLDESPDFLLQMRKTQFLKKV